MFSKEEIMLILEALAAKYGHGYSSVVEVGVLQAKLSILLERANTRVQPTTPSGGGSVREVIARNAESKKVR